MEPGDLVRITRSSMACSAGTIALIVEGYTSPDNPSDDPMEIWIVRLMNGELRRYLTQDLEAI